MPNDPDKFFDETLIAFVHNLGKYRERMLMRGVTLGRVSCPRCGKKTCVLAIKGTKQHVWASCSCGFRMME